MMSPETYEKMFYWRKSRSWYVPDDGIYAARLTDAAPEKARDSFAFYKAEVDNLMSIFGEEPVDGHFFPLYKD